MDKAVSDCRVEGFEAIINTLTLPDADDRARRRDSRRSLARRS